MADNQRLAIDGGERAVTAGPFPWPPDDPVIREALDAVWRDGDWGRYQGARCGQLRRRLGELHAVEHVHLCSSGTIGVELALRAVGVGPGDGVLLAGYDFPGNFRAIEAVGATPVLIDIDPTSWSMDVALLAELAGSQELDGVRAVLVSHLHGGLADMAALRELADKRGWMIVEDACQAVGATLAGRPVGAWGDIGVLSFGGSKLLTAGRGGALLTDDAMLNQRLRVVTGRGNDLAPLSELQAAVLLPQLETFAEKHGRRRAAVERLRLGNAAINEKWHLVAAHEGSSHAYYKLAWLAPVIGGGKAVSGRVGALAALQAEGVPADQGFRGFATRSGRRCRTAGSLAHSIAASEETILLHHPILLGGEAAIDQVAAAFKKVAAAMLPGGSAKQVD